MMKIAILSLEHQAGVDALCAVLRTAGHECVLYGNQKALVDGLRAAPCDLLVLNMPSADADLAALLDVAKGVASATGGRLPVLALVDPDARSPEVLSDLITAGLDDYLVQPVRRRDLTMRVDVLLRRAWPEKMDLARLQLGPFVFDTLSGKLHQDGRPIDLTHKEFELALLFFRHLNRPLSRATLLETLWAREADATSRTVDTHVSRVRKKLCLQAPGQFCLLPVYGFGYVLKTAESEE